MKRMKQLTIKNLLDKLKFSNMDNDIGLNYPLCPIHDDNKVDWLRVFDIKVDKRSKKSSAQLLLANNSVDDLKFRTMKVEDFISKLDKWGKNNSVIFSVNECYDCNAEGDPFGSFDIGMNNYVLTDVNISNEIKVVELLYKEY